VELTPRCRHCDAPLVTTFVDLGSTPLCESFLLPEEVGHEPYYPLHAMVCSECLLVQVDEFASPAAIFDDYAYFSSYSTAWLEHSRRYVDMAIDRFDLDAESRVMEIASNDGYLLQYFIERGIPALGIEPAANVAAAAEERGVPTRVEFFDLALAEKLNDDGYSADLVIGNNVLAQVPGLNDFVVGVAAVLSPTGVATFEFPHLVRLIEDRQFDTIYHEHFSYFSLMTAQRIFAAAGLTLFDVDELWTHGGSLRIYLRHQDDTTKPVEPSVGDLLAGELEFGIADLSTYTGFGEQVDATKQHLVSFLTQVKQAGGSIAIYGAAGKGNTLLNYCGIGTELVDYACDRNPYKHGRYTPGTHIPIYPPSHLEETKPDYVFILPWNLKEEIMRQLDYIRDWGGRFIVPIPDVAVYPEETP
jgi:SAM-dependent methyltransferase